MTLLAASLLFGTSLIPTNLSLKVFDRSYDMSFVSQNLPPLDVLLDLGKTAEEEPAFVEFMHELSSLGFVLVYEQDEDMTSTEFEQIVRTRWETMKRAWRLRNGRQTD
jgi:hypothetical protein